MMGRAFSIWDMSDEGLSDVTSFFEWGKTNSNVVISAMISTPMTKKYINGCFSRFLRFVVLFIAPLLYL